MENYDLIVLGGGPGGYLSAERAGDLGMKVLLIEKERLGGVCLNRGCIPTKTLLHSAKLYHYACHSENYGVNIEKVSYDLGRARAWKDKVVETQVKGIEYLMKKSGVAVVEGEGRLVDRRTVALADTSYSADNIIIATGSRPVIIPVPGADLPHVMSSRDALDLEALPESLVIVGGGVIGMEFASFYSTVGVPVTVIELLPEIISQLDKDITLILRKSLPKVEIHLGHRVTSISAEAVVFTDGEEEKEVKAEKILMAAGRAPYTEGLDLEKAGVDYDGKGIRVNDRMQTNVPGLYAVGDVTGRSLLAHTAYRMAEVAVNSISGTSDRMRYEAVPWVVYTLPELAGVGLTEAQAVERGVEVKTASVPMRINGRYLAEHGREPGMCKVVVDARLDRLLGVQMAGGPCSEIVFGAAAMIEAELRIKDIREIIFPHPTVSEVIKDALWAIQ